MLHRSTISPARSILMVSGSTFSSQNFGTEHNVALLDNGVTVPIESSLYAHSTIFSIHPFVTTVSEFNNSTSFTEDCCIPILILLENPLLLSLWTTITFFFFCRSKYGAILSSGLLSLINISLFFSKSVFLYILSKHISNSS